MGFLISNESSFSQVLILKMLIIYINDFSSFDTQKTDKINCKGGAGPGTYFRDTP